MTVGGVSALGLGIADVTSVIMSLSDEDWSQPSACVGWSVRDVVAHLGSEFKEEVEPSVHATQLPMEQSMALLVEARRSWTVAAIRDEYLRYSDRALETLANQQTEPAASEPITIADIGTYPQHLIANAYAFDHLCHLRSDLLRPRGPLTRSVPPLDSARLGPAIEWMLAEIPRVEQGLAGHLAAPIGLILLGPGGGTWRLAKSEQTIVVQAELWGDEVASVSSRAEDFVTWATTRRPWRECCDLSGDAPAATAFLDALRLI